MHVQYLYIQYVLHNMERWLTRRGCRAYGIYWDPIIISPSHTTSLKPECSHTPYSTVHARLLRLVESNNADQARGLVLL